MRRSITKILSNKEHTVREPLKKIPKEKGKVNTKEKSVIQIDISKSKNNYNGLIDLAKRKLTKSNKSSMPIDIKPMLATLADQPFDDPEWQFELKLDGYRCLAYLKSGTADLKSRNNNSFNLKFAPVYQALKDWKINAVVDGEIVVLNEEGVPDFNFIQQWNIKKEGSLVYYVFDLLWIDGLNIMEEPLHLRREILKQIVPENSIIRFSDHIEDVGIDFFEAAKQTRLEGIIAKNKNAAYIPDSRTKNWLKIKTEQRHEAIICGYTVKKTTDRLFSSLVLGIYKGQNLVYLGQTGTGFTVAMQKDLFLKFKPLIIDNCPFKEIPDIDSPTFWMKPELICEIKYAELTSENVMRHASFQGLRLDKKASDLNDEKAIVTKKVISELKKDQDDNLVNTSENEKVVEINGNNLKFTNLQKYYWPKEKITKGMMLNYYNVVAEFMLPYMKDRPQSLNRFPNGVDGKNFYHKNMGGKVDNWLMTFERLSESSNEAKDFLVCTNKASLLYMANLGCIEMNPWHSRIQSPLKPDWCVIDLDPGEISFHKVIETAIVVKQVLDSLGVPSFPKTSGSTGIHIYLPLGAKYNYEQSKQLAELIVNMVHQEIPSFTSLVRDPKKRTDKIYLDYLQNRPIQTICAPYSVRPKKDATVSAPLHWSEVKKGLSISKFTMKNMVARIQTEGDLFTGVLGKGIDLNKVLQGLASLI